jgi:hypothetical protein
MAVVGESVAAGETTALCTKDVSPCPSENQVQHIHETTLALAPITILNNILNIKCQALLLGDVTFGQALGGVIGIQGSYIYSNCAEGCEVTELNGPGWLFFTRLGSELADVELESEILVKCMWLHCVFNGAGLLADGVGTLLSQETNGELWIGGQQLNRVGGLLCPSTAKLDLATTPLAATYISS